MKTPDGTYCHVLPGFSSAMMALQPIVHVGDRYRLFACEALVRGVNGEGARQVFDSVSPQDLVQFDAACRAAAITLAQFLNMKGKLSFNIPASVICDARFGLHSTLKTARDVEWPANRLIMEITESEPLRDLPNLKRWIAAARNRGVELAIDDFGAGYSNMTAILELQPDFLKLDMGLIRNIDRDKIRQAMVKGIAGTCATFNCRVIAEGVETVAERETLRTLGITLMQGHLFAMPGSNGVPEIARPAITSPEVARPRPQTEPAMEERTMNTPPEAKRRSLH